MDRVKKEKSCKAIGQERLPWMVTFEVEKELPFGKALFISGGSSQLGGWQPTQAVKLSWNDKNRWIGQIAIPKSHTKLFEFKFIISDWNITQNSNIEWEKGCNRKLDLLSLPTLSKYRAQWNMQQVYLCLHVNYEPDTCDRFYLSGNLTSLGGWKQKKLLKPLGTDIKQSLSVYFKNNPQFQCQPDLSNIKFYSFSISREIDWCNYIYIKQGQTVQSDILPGRVLQFGCRNGEPGRILEFQYEGNLMLIDESCFQNSILQKMTNQIYLACHIKNQIQMNKLHQKNITALINLSSGDEDHLISNYHLKMMCKRDNVIFNCWKVKELTNPGFVKQVQLIVAMLQKLLEEGHRVCIHCSMNIIRSAPIKALYLTLLMGYPFSQAIELMSRETPLTQSNCKVAEDVFHMVQCKMSRGKIIISSS